MVQPRKDKGLKNRFASLFELPRDVLLDLPRLTIIGALQVCIENHRGIIEYSAEKIRINLEGRELAIMGKDLAIGVITEEEIIVEGSIEGLNFQ